MRNIKSGLMALMALILTLGLVVGGATVASASAGGSGTYLRSDSTGSVRIIGHTSTGANRSLTLSRSGITTAVGFRDVITVEVLPGTVVQRFCYLGSGVRTTATWGYAGSRTYRSACGEGIRMVLYVRHL